MAADPFFADAENEDYHLKSQAWRWDNERGRWHYDEVTSPCIDAGNPGSALQDELLTAPDAPNNLWGVNLRINMGAYGGTDQASMAPHGASLLADITNDGLVNMNDFAAQALYLCQPPMTSPIPGDLNRDGLVDAKDLVLLAEDWLKWRTNCLPTCASSGN